MDRLQRLGHLQHEHPDSSAVLVDSACSTCVGGCWRLRQQKPSSVLELHKDETITASEGATVAVSVSRSGLTRLSALLFAPSIAALLLLAYAADRGIDGWLLLGFGAAALSLAFSISRSLVKPRVRQLLAVETRLIVSG